MNAEPRLSDERKEENISPETWLVAKRKEDEFFQLKLEREKKKLSDLEKSIERYLSPAVKAKLEKARIKVQKCESKAEKARKKREEAEKVNQMINNIADGQNESEKWLEIASKFGIAQSEAIDIQHTLAKQEALNFYKAAMYLENAVNSPQNGIIETFKTNFKGGLNSKIIWVGAAVLATVEVGHALKQYFDGHINLKTFCKKTLVSTVSNACGVVGGVFGNTVGGMIGTMICPVIGTTILAFFGGLISGFLSQHYAKKCMDNFLDIPEGEGWEEREKEILYHQCLEKFGAKDTDSQNQIKNRRLCQIRKYHPDKNIGNEKWANEMFVEQMICYSAIVGYRKRKGRWVEENESYEDVIVAACADL